MTRSTICRGCTEAWRAGYAPISGGVLADQAHRLPSAIHYLLLAVWLDEKGLEGLG